MTTKTTEHTPGPLLPGHILPCGCRLYFDRNDNNAIAWCPTHATAPDLLSVAEGALGYLESLPHDCRPDEQWFIPLRAAIAKATGREEK